MGTLVEVEVAAGVGRIFLNRPAKVNALSSELLDELLSAVRKIDARVVVLAGRGRAFCGGADVNELASLAEDTAASFVLKIHSVCEAIRALPVPVVASLHGACIGAGLEIAAACDLRIAADGTQLAMPEVRLGIPSVVEAALLPRLVGAGRAAWLVLTGEPIDARTACDWGLVEETCTPELLPARTERLVKNLLAGDARALAMQKELLRTWEEAPLANSIDTSARTFARAYRDGAPPALKRLLR